VKEHDDEPVPGLPELLPADERILWQGAPRWQSLARRAFHVGNLGIYFGVLIAWRAGTLLYDGETLAQALVAIAWLVPLALSALGILAFIAWLMARTTLYTITNRRIVLRIGVVLTVSFNIPFATMASAGLRSYPDGTGDIPIALAGEDRISYLHLWPHARPWRVARPQPMLRAVPDVAVVSEILTRAVQAAEGPAVRQARPASIDAALPASESRPLATAQ
jgi:Bacterial PH domain